MKKEKERKKERRKTKEKARKKDKLSYGEMLNILSWVISY
jgi:hypothetical protein